MQAPLDVDELAGRYGAQDVLMLDPELITRGFRHPQW
jgi:hypothetical protein